MSEQDKIIETKSVRTNRINKVNPFQDGDANKINWKDHEYQQDAAARDLTELFPGIFIDQGEVDMINFLIANYNGKPVYKKVMITRAINIAEMKTASGLVVDSQEFEGKYDGKHGEEVREYLKDSLIAIVLTVGAGNQDSLQRGDIVRFCPISQKTINIVNHQARIIHESDIQTIEGNIFGPKQDAF